LSLVERHHGKVVEKVRKQTESFLEEEAVTYGDALNVYSAEFMKAEAGLEDVVNDAKAGLKASEASPAKSWPDPLVMQRAKLNSQLAATGRDAKHEDRARANQLREATEHSEESLETQANKLGLKLGDMTPLVDKAKKTLEAHVEKASVAAAVVKASKTSASANVDLASLQGELTKASLKERTEAVDAKKKLDGFLSKADKEIDTKRAKIEEGLDAAGRAENSQVLGAPAVHKATPVAKTMNSKLVPAVELLLSDFEVDEAEADLSVKKLSLAKFVPKCLAHTQNLVNSIDNAYTDAQLKSVLTHDCVQAKEFPHAHKQKFKSHDACLKFAQKLSAARDVELKTGKKDQYKKFCTDYYKHATGKKGSSKKESKKEVKKEAKKDAKKEAKKEVKKEGKKEAKKEVKKEPKK